MLARPCPRTYPSRHDLVAEDPELAGPIGTHTSRLAFTTSSVPLVDHIHRTTPPGPGHRDQWREVNTAIVNCMNQHWVTSNVEDAGTTGKIKKTPTLGLVCHLGGDHHSFCLTGTGAPPLSPRECLHDSALAHLVPPQLTPGLWWWLSPILVFQIRCEPSPRLFGLASVGVGRHRQQVAEDPDVVHRHASANVGVEDPEVNGALGWPSQPHLCLWWSLATSTWACPSLGKVK